MSERHVRIGDAEREQAAAALGEHFAQGRLTLEEHAERLDQIWSARTHGDLEPIFRDLPGQPARSSTTRAPRSPWQGFRTSRRGLPFPVFPVLALLVILTIVTHAPIILFGLIVFWVLTSRHRLHRWSSRR
ncbi:MAG: hypothetical protein JWO11_3344 [Nocardioides sp.]|nr:hypothetical protein [Nocardioides sp.]